MGFSSAWDSDGTLLHSCTLSLSSSYCENLMEIMDFLDVTVRMFEEEEFSSEYPVIEGSSIILDIWFYSKFSGKYYVYASLYGEQVQGSPVVVEVKEDSDNCSLGVK